MFEKKAGQKQESKERDVRGDDRRDNRRGDDYRDSRGGRSDEYRDSRGGGARGRSRSPPREHKSIEEQIREREREKALSVGNRTASVRFLLSVCCRWARIMQTSGRRRTRLL